MATISQILSFVTYLIMKKIIYW